MKKIILVFSCLLFFQCSADRTIVQITDDEVISLEKFQRMDSLHKLFIADEKEPGEELMLCLTFIDKASKEVLPNQKVSFYHTSTIGEYEPSNPNDETTARLNGTAITNQSGEIFVKTILPGDYGSGKNNRHVHTTVHSARPEAYDIFFEQYSSGFGGFMNSGNDQIFYANLKKTADSTLVSFLTMEVKNLKK